MNFLETVNTVSKFTDTAIIAPVETYFTDSSQSFFARVMSETPQNSEIGFYDNISNFLRVVGLFSEPQIEINQDVLHISENSEDHTGSANFVSSDTRLIRNTITTDIPQIIERTLSVEPTLTVKVTKPLVQRIKSATSAIANSKLIIHSRDGKIEFVIKDVDVLMSSSNTYKFEVEGASTKDCTVALDAGFFNKMASEFDLKLVFSPKASTFRAILQEPELTVVIPTAHSTI